MPGLVAFRRRWSVGSDDLVVPGTFLLVIHVIWAIVLVVDLAVIYYDKSVHSIELLWFYKVGYLAVVGVSLCVELIICVTSLRGSILETGPRASMQYLIYLKVVVMLVEIAWLILGIMWLKEFYLVSPIEEAKEIMFGLVVSNLMANIIIMTTTWCTFDEAGRSWVKMKKYQRSMKESESRFNYKRSGSRSRNWRQRKVIRAYQDSWDHRCRLLFCCMGSSERNRNSFTDIARLLSDFFRDLDVVPSDVIAGLVLLRKFQKLEREAIVRQRKNGTFEFLSGAAITEKTNFLALNDTRDYDYFQNVIHYMYFAQSAYGWPMYLITHPRTGICQLCSGLRCCFLKSACCCCSHQKAKTEVVQDNCCYCNFAALKKMQPSGDIEVIYVTYHVDVGETPFFVAIDYTKQKVVISIRGTLSMKDILTDLNAEGECLPLDPPREDWLGHKGMVQAAVYIKNKLEEENLIAKALNYNPDRGTNNFDLVLVGHSLGAGTASILAILLKAQFPTLKCYSYSPPGGLLSMPAVEYSKSFITSVVVGKDVVPRIGLHQMEALRADLINAIKRSVDPKWKTIACSVFCCGCGPEPTSVSKMASKVDNINAYEEQRTSARNATTHPNDSSIALTLHHPLYPPGRIIHVIRHHPTADEQRYEKGWRQILNNHEPVYQAIWAETTDFDEVLISPRMFKDHMPDKVLAALNKVITTCGPRKPQRSSNANSSIASDDIAILSQLPPSPVHNCLLTPSQTQRLCLETSFTGLQSPLNDFRPPEVDEVSCGSTNPGTVRQTLSISEATTVLVDEKLGKRAVAFDTTREIITTGRGYSAVSPNNNIMPRGILQSQNCADKRLKKPMSLSFQEVQLSRTISNASSYDNVKPPSLDRNNKIDLIHDDWFGLAPLASPESLSEISSISSRATSLGKLNFNGSLEREFFMASCQEEGGILDIQEIQELQNNNEEDLLIESELKTPVIMRRAPKISGDLSKCASDSAQLDKYKRMGQVFITPQIDHPEQDEETDSSNGDHFVASISFSRPKKQQSHFPSSLKKRFVEISSSSDSSISGSFQTAQNDDKNSLLIDFNSKSTEFLNPSHNTSDKLNRSEELLMSSKEDTEDISLKQDKKLTMSDSAILNEDLEKERLCQIPTAPKTKKVTIIGSSSDTYHSATSSISNHFEDGVLFFKQEPITSKMESGLLESHFPVLEEMTENTSLISSQPSFGRTGSISSSTDRSSPLPLLSSMAGIYKSASSSPSRFRSSPSRRKIYPVTIKSNPSYVTSRSYSTSKNNNNNSNSNLRTKKAINFAREEREESNV